MTDAFDPVGLSRDITTLLRHFDWLPIYSDDRYQIWRLENSEQEVLIPVDPSRGDFAALLRRAEEYLLMQYGRPAQDVLTTIQMRFRAVLDSLQWRRASVLDGGIIGWPQGEELYGAARAQLAASAKSAQTNRPYHGHSGAYLAKRYLESALMGQTQIGSFVITALSPANQRFYPSKSLEERAQEPGGTFDVRSLSGRLIVDTFERAIRGLRSALDDYKRAPNINVFRDVVDEGVSFEFTRALSVITGGSEAEVVISRVEAHRQSVETDVKIAFTPPESSILNTAAIELSAGREPEDVTLVGDVTLLSREGNGTENLIRLNVYQGADVRKARVRLSPEQYEIALEAHRREEPLHVSGRLEKEGQLFWLYSPTDVAIVTEEAVGSRSEPLDTQLRFP